MFNRDMYEKQLNAGEKEDRLEAVRELKAAVDRGDIPSQPRLGECDNHIHSQFSFSPYSPSMIAWKAYLVGLDTCGIIDHESVAGVEEFREACEILGIAPTIGVEVRMNWDGTPLEGKKFNNPDQLSVGYFPVHGLPIRSLEEIETFLKPIRGAREKRNRKMTQKIHEILVPYGMELDFDKHVIPVSRWTQKGSITERHLLFAAGLQMIGRFGKDRALVDFLKNKLEINVSANAEAWLSDPDNAIYEFDLTNVLKGFFSELMYVDADHIETPDVEPTIRFFNDLGCIPTYTYLGDVRGESVTGDKKVQKFEDDILDELFECLYQYGMRGFSYAPARNAPDQIARVRELCRKYGMLEICGVDINQPRQDYITKYRCDADRQFFNDSTWAIIGHEKEAQKDLRNSIISAETETKMPDLAERIAYYK
ncbi:MAG: PHP domain-containing protein, partial [Eubacterium sp.]|nr:PHP domain-containing protein [Eubacterium sp.]